MRHAADYLTLFLIGLFCATSIACDSSDDDDDDAGVIPETDDSASDDTVSDDDSNASDDVQDDSSDDVADDSVDDSLDDSTDDSVADDTLSNALQILAVNPPSGGATAATRVTLTGENFAAGMLVAVGDVQAESIVVLSSVSAKATFPAVELTDCGFKDVHVENGEDEDTLIDGFEYFFDEDPIVFIHGFLGDDSDFDRMKERFSAIGYPEDYLNAVDFSDSTQSNLNNARDELPPFVEEVLERTGREKVDVVAHSMGGLSSRLWIKEYGGSDKVRDYISLAGTQHGNWEACVVEWIWESAAELCPAYAGQGDAENDLQWILNGDPDEEDVDETPSGVEDGGAIYWNAAIDGLDTVVIPNSSGCLNQGSQDDCSDPINRTFPYMGHMDMIYSEEVFEYVSETVRAHNISHP